MTSTTPVVTLSPRDYDAVLFDLDGVLTKTASVHAWVLARSDRPRAMSYFAEALQSDVSDRTRHPPRRARSFKQHIIRTFVPFVCFVVTTYL